MPAASPTPFGSRRFLGWDPVAGGALLQLLHMSLFFSSFGVYVVAWEADLGWTRTATAAGFAAMTVVSGGLGVLLGRLLEAVGVRRIVAAGLAALVAGLLALSVATTLVHFYAAMALVGLGLAMSGFLPVTAAVVPWFTTRRSTAMAVMSLGLSAGGFLVPLVATSVEELGWRVTLRLSAAAVVALAGPIIVTMRRPPDAYGQRPQGLRADPEAAPAPRSFTLAEAVRTPAFWLLAGGHAAALLIVNALNVHLVPHLVAGGGYALTEAAAVVTLVTIALGVGQLLGGPLGDRFDKRGLATLAMLGHAVAIALLAVRIGPVVVPVAAVLHGVAWGVRGPLMTTLRADYFGPAHFASIMGASMTLFLAGQLIGPVFAGALADLVGGYRTPFAILAAVGVAAAYAFRRAHPPTPPDGAIR
ncbi:MAG: MFS transporter [Trueperaceae bacterium]|nr:MFS transporter [Trueperaceae bacterium]